MSCYVQRMLDRKNAQVKTKYTSSPQIVLVFLL